MTTRQYLIGLFLVLCGVLPIVGASCPPPNNPPLLGVITNDNALTQAAVPACVAGFVCVSFANQATIPVQMALYRHNGFDPANQFADPPSFQCCTNPNSISACPCPCTGAAIGECKLTRNEIFLPSNLDTINGVQSLTLAAGQTILAKRVRCGDAKTLGAAVALATGDVLANPDDQNGPVYRDEPGGVACGQTVQFLVVNLNEAGVGTGSNQLAQLIIQTLFSH